jgi:putative FmdB family regulatory protein
VPTYVYECKVCGHQFETFQKMTDEPVKECPQCRGEVARVLCPVGIIFKGSDFHVNDYPTSAPDDSKKPESPDESKIGAKTETAEAAKS